MIRTFLGSLIIIALSIGAIGYQTNGFRVFTSESKRRLSIQENPQKVISVQLQTHQDKIVDWNYFEGKYLIVDFIYTQCETLCYGLGFEFAKLQKNAEDLILNSQLQLLTISFDAEHDTPEALSEYIGRFSDDKTSWVAARVTKGNQQERLLKQFGVVAIPDGEGGYVHNAALHLVSPSGELMRIVDYDKAVNLLDALRKGILNTIHESGNIVYYNSVKDEKL